MNIRQKTVLTPLDVKIRLSKSLKDNLDGKGILDIMCEDIAKRYSEPYVEALNPLFESDLSFKTFKHEPTVHIHNNTIIGISIGEIYYS